MSEMAGKSVSEAGCTKPMADQPADKNKEELSKGKDAASLSSGLSSTGSLTGWHTTTAWAGVIIAWYFMLQMVILPRTMQTDPAARELMLSQVPMRIYQYSEAAFFTAAVLNLISFVFEETPEKRQLALLSALIKGLSWHCDYLIVTGRAVITFDGYGALLLPSRYVQWSCTTPTILFTISKISDFSHKRIALTMFSDWVMILTGYLAAVYPPGLTSFLSLFVSYATFYIVLWNLFLMLNSALAEANSPHAKMSLHFTLWSSMLVWNLFPVAWVVARMGPRFAVFGEPMLIFANFGAKVVFSSCIMYNNFVTLQQRRVAAQLLQEQRERIRMVAELKSAVKQKDEFISVIGHELRTPLNAVIQLSTAINANLGAPGSVEKHRVWMETIIRSAKHLLGIINDIITVRAARGGVNLKQELVYMDHVVDHVVRTLTPMAKPGVVVQKVVARQLPPMVADERRVIQLLSNVLGNALKFTEKGKVAVRVRTDAGGRNIIIKIDDTGCGIPKQELGNLLLPFKQADMSSRRKYGGTGLGLSIANQLVEAHTGSLKLDSIEGEGTTATITLPVLQLETLERLREPFREAYTARGYDYDELMSPEVAEAEGRRNPTFRSSLEMQGSIRRPTGPHTATCSLRSSMDMQNADTEQYQWTQDFTDDCEGIDEDLLAESAAASGMPGPPPMAVALVSSLYATTAVKPPSAAGAAAASYVTPAAANPRYATTSKPVSTSHQLSDTAMSSSDLVLRMQQPGGRPALPQQEELFDVSVLQSPSTAPLPKLQEMDEVADEVDMLEQDDWAGSWHKPAKFGDTHDADKQYYAYENRISYEYRPSIDAGGSWRSSAPDEQGFKAAFRRSIDHLRGSMDKHRSADRETSGSNISAAGLSQRSSASRNAELREKFFGVKGLTKSLSNRTSWQATRKEDL